MSRASGTAKAGAAGSGRARGIGGICRTGQSGRARLRPTGRADGRLAPHGPGGEERGREAPRLPPVRLAPREELAGSARVAPLLRAAREVARWLRSGRPGPGGERQAAAR